MINQLKQNFEKYGTDFKVYFNGDIYTGKAFVSPLRYKNRVYLGDNYEEGGVIDGGRYTFIGPPDVRLDKMDNTAVIEIDGEEYIIKRAELFISGNKGVYMWAIIVKSRGGDSGGSFFG